MSVWLILFIGLIIGFNVYQADLLQKMKDDVRMTKARTGKILQAVTGQQPGAADKAPAEGPDKAPAEGGSDDPEEKASAGGSDKKAGAGKASGAAGGEGQDTTIVDRILKMVYA